MESIITLLKIVAAIIVLDLHRRKHYHLKEYTFNHIILPVFKVYLGDLISNTCKGKCYLFMWLLKIVTLETKTQVFVNHYI